MYYIIHNLDQRDALERVIQSFEWVSAFSSTFVQWPYTSHRIKYKVISSLFENDEIIKIELKIPSQIHTKNLRIQRSLEF